MDSICGKNPTLEPFGFLWSVPEVLSFHLELFQQDQRTCTTLKGSLTLSNLWGPNVYPFLMFGLAV